MTCFPVPQRILTLMSYLRQVPYKPNDVRVDISTPEFLFTDSPGEVPDRLDVSWTTPTLDAATQLFATVDGGEKINKPQPQPQPQQHQHQQQPDEKRDEKQMAVPRYLRANNIFCPSTTGALVLREQMKRKHTRKMGELC